MIIRTTTKSTLQIAEMIAHTFNGLYLLFINFLHTLHEDIKNAVLDKKPDTKTATLAELIEYGEWLKGIQKTEFPRIKKEGK